jgi:RNA polymerase sigma factor (sigma-70 family)
MGQDRRAVEARRCVGLGAAVGNRLLVDGGSLQRGRDPLALAARRRYRRRGGRADSWLFAIAYRKLADSLRRGSAEDRARRRLGIERIELTDDDIERIERLGQPGSVAELVRELPLDQREAIQARVIEERGYGEIAAELETSEAVVRKRVSRGLAAIRRRLGGAL